jgi:hypothetical protein
MKVSEVNIINNAFEKMLLPLLYGEIRKISGMGSALLAVPYLMYCRCFLFCALGVSLCPLKGKTCKITRRDSAAERYR